MIVISPNCMVVPANIRGEGLNIWTSSSFNMQTLYKQSTFQLCLKPFICKTDLKKKTPWNDLHQKGLGINIYLRVKLFNFRQIIRLDKNLLLTFYVIEKENGKLRSVSINGSFKKIRNFRCCLDAFFQIKSI